MPEKYYRLTKDELSARVEELERVAANAAKLLKSIESASLDSAWVSWSSTSDMKVSSLAEIITKSQGMIEEQVSARKMGRQSRYESVPEITAKTIAARKKRTNEPASSKPSVKPSGKRGT